MLNYQRVIVVGDEKGKGSHMLLVGALELFGATASWNFMTFQKNIWDVILPIDELIFFKMVETTSQYKWP